MMTTPSKSLVTEPPVWFITGCSTGFGLELAKLAIERGYRTVSGKKVCAKLALTVNWRLRHRSGCVLGVYNARDGDHRATQQ